MVFASIARAKTGVLGSSSRGLTTIEPVATLSVDTIATVLAGSAFARFGVSVAFVPGTTVRNDGQSPFMHEKSLLHDDWWICVLRPNSVSTGMTLRQLDLRPQSPQPSQTRSLITTLCGGSASLPLRRSRFFS